MNQSYYGFGLPINISAHGAPIDRLIVLVHIFMAVLFVGWFTYLILALVKFRERPGHKADYRERHFKLPSYLEVMVALFEFVLLIGFAFPILNQVKYDFPPKESSLEVRIVAEQFAWNIHYPGPDGVFGTRKPELLSSSNPLGLDRQNDPKAKDDITTINQLRIPVHKPIIVHLSSKDVIHSFFLPVMRVKQDAIPGQEIPLWFEANQTGKFEIACAQLCGLGHYRMRGFFTVDTLEDFNKWLITQAPKQG